MKARGFTSGLADRSGEGRVSAANIDGRRLFLLQNTINKVVYMKSESISKDWLGLVQGLADRIRFGQVVITIHQGKVVQVEHTEKTRLEQPTTVTPAAIRST